MTYFGGNSRNGNPVLLQRWRPELALCSSRAAAMRAEEVSSNGVAVASAAEGANKLFMGGCPGEREREEPPRCSLGPVRLKPVPAILSL